MEKKIKTGKNAKRHNGKKGPVLILVYTATGTGTVEGAAPEVLSDMRNEALQWGFTNSNAGPMVQGQEVFLKSDGTVDLRVDGSKPPLGVVIIGGETTKRVTVRVFATALAMGIAKGGTVVAGTMVVPDGTLDATNKYPGYKTAVSDDLSCGLVIKGGTVNSVIKVAIIDGFTVIP